MAVMKAMNVRGRAVKCRAQQRQQRRGAKEVRTAGWIGGETHRTAPHRTGRV